MADRKHARLRLIGPTARPLDLQTARPAPKTADSFYHSREWRELVAAIIKTRGRRCEAPGCLGPHHPHQRIYGDHIVELQDGGAPLDPTNVMLRCAHSHTRKTAASRAARMRG